MGTNLKALFATAAVALVAIALPALGSDADGPALFEKHCAVCHPAGDNIINPDKTLKRADLMAAGITGADDIVKLLRDPGPGMRVFTPEELPDGEALAVGTYIWETLSH